MGVIPFVLDGPQRSVVENKDDFDRGGNVVCIESLDKAQLLSSSEANACYDLSVGAEFRDHRDSGKRELLQQSDEITLHPGAAVIIETEEVVHFPKSIFGQIVPKVSLLQQGITNTSSKVDPGYEGHLLITLFNLGKKTIPLHRHQHICSLYLLQVLGDSRPYSKTGKRIHGEASRNSWQQLRDFLERNTAPIMVILLIATVVLTIIQILDRVSPASSGS